jgi:anthranilate synthase component 1
LQQMHMVKKIPGERFTPFSLAGKLEALAILESSSISKGRERYSLLLIKEAFRIEQRERDCFLITPGKNRKKIRNGGRDILDAVKIFAGFHGETEYDFPFPAGGIGFLSFEFARFCDDINFVTRTDALELPDASFIFGNEFLIFDHYTDEIYILVLNYPGHSIDLEATMDRIENRILDLNFNYMAEPPKNVQAVVISNNLVEQMYKKNVEHVRQEIIKGNLLQAVPSRRLEIRTEIKAMDAYRNLRSANPSPYLFYLDFGDYQIFGASPEVHVKVNKGKVIIRPLAGTRRRGKNEAEDQALAKELLEDEKERAEHLMLIDLARNDLGRVCKPGSIRVSEYMLIEKYSRVMHIVSQVEGELLEDKDSTDAVRASFPAGTVSGAPKIRAIETISKLENFNRGFYAGLVGYMDATGDMDTCITIRSGLKRNDILYLQAGGGVVYDSNPERELEETNEKLRATASAVGVEI